MSNDIVNKLSEVAASVNALKVSFVCFCRVQNPSVLSVWVHRQNRAPPEMQIYPRSYHYSKLQNARREED